NLDALDKTVLLITANATANWTINLRGNASWSLDSHPGLLRQDPTLAAATLYRDHARGRDDCGVLVWKG
ncbi:MAG: hypothetical protein J0H99_01805, partial [Rhodospirillales bacterium]|nr:hypothetical protein [Rhodospirillales bacterium]